MKEKFKFNVKLNNKLNLEKSNTLSFENLRIVCLEKKFSHRGVSCVWIKNDPKILNLLKNKRKEIKTISLYLF